MVSGVTGPDESDDAHFEPMPNIIKKYVGTQS